MIDIRLRINAKSQIRLTTPSKHIYIAIIRLVGRPKWKPGVGHSKLGLPVLGVWWWRFGFYVDVYPRIPGEVERGEHIADAVAAP